MSKICQNLKNSNFQTKFDKFFTGTNLDRFGVRGAFECCEGKKGSQNQILNKFKTTPTPNKNGSKGVNVRVHMP